MNKHYSILFIPLLGMLLFVILYVIAAYHYPGGSYVNPSQSGFSFRYNYLCDLLDNFAIDGVPLIQEFVRNKFPTIDRIFGVT